MHALTGSSAPKSPLPCPWVGGPCLIQCQRLWQDARQTDRRSDHARQQVLQQAEPVRAMPNRKNKPSLIFNETPV